MSIGIGCGLASLCSSAFRYYTQRTHLRAGDRLFTNRSIREHTREVSNSASQRPSSSCSDSMMRFMRPLHSRYCMRLVLATQRHFERRAALRVPQRLWRVRSNYTQVAVSLVPTYLAERTIHRLGIRPAPMKL